MGSKDLVPMGRPTKLNQELIIKAAQYQSKDLIPTIEEFALYLGINRSTVYAWKEKNKDFSNIVDNILSNQARALINGGLSGDFNSSITKLILSGKHGYVEKQEVDNTHTVVQPILGGESTKKIEADDN